MTEFSNGLTPAQDERLAVLEEEMGEILQEIGKIRRHGYESRNPDWKDDGAGPAPTNRQSLEKEIGDFSAAIELMFEAADITQQSVLTGARLKLMKLQRWLHHPENLTLLHAAMVRDVMATQE